MALWEIASLGHLGHLHSASASSLDFCGDLTQVISFLLGVSLSVSRPPSPAEETGHERNISCLSIFSLNSACKLNHSLFSLFPIVGS